MIRLDDGDNQLAAIEAAQVRSKFKDTRGVPIEKLRQYAMDHPDLYPNYIKWILREYLRLNRREL